MSIKWVKEITRRMIDKAGPSAVSVAVELGIKNSSSVTFWTSDEHLDRSIPLHHALELNEWTGDMLLKEYASRRGYKLEKLGEKERASTSAIIRLAAIVAQLAGSSAHEIIERGLDGTYCNNDSHAIRATIGELQNVLHEIVDSLP